MPYLLHYHPDVLTEDLPKIDLRMQERIRRAIEGRLATEPTYYGEPLRHRLKGYWKLRVGDFRVVYRLEDNDVWIQKIGHRKEVYEGPPR